MSLGLPSKTLAAPNTAKLANAFEIRARPNETLVVSSGARSQTAIFKMKNERTVVLAQPYIAQSVQSVRNRAKEDGIDAINIRVVRGVKTSFFYYETKDGIHVYSTIGGRLLISKVVGSNFDIKRVSLLEKSQRVAAR